MDRRVIFSPPIFFARDLLLPIQPRGARGAPTLCHCKTPLIPQKIGRKTAFYLLLPHYTAAIRLIPQLYNFFEIIERK